MKKIFTLLNVLLVIFLATNISAQKAKVGNLKVKAKYLQFPSIGFDTTVNSYSVKLKMNESFLTRQTYNLDWFKKKISINGYPKLDFGGDVIVEATIGNVTMDKPRYQTRTVTPKKGKAYKEYYIELPYKHVFSYKIIDRKSGDTIYENNFMERTGRFGSYSNYPDEGVWTSDKYRNVKKIEAWWNKNRHKIYTSIRKNTIKKNLNRISKDLNVKFGFSPAQAKVKLKKLKSKKHPQYNDYHKLEQVVKDAFDSLDYYSVEKFKKTIKPAMDFWLENEAKYNGADKNEKKLKYACQLDLAHSYYWMDDFENAKKWAQKVAEGDYKSKDGKKLIKKIDKTLEKISKIHRNAQHFKITPGEDDIALDNKMKKEIEEKIQKGDIAYFPDFNKRMGVTDKSKIKKIELFVKNGKHLKGYVVYEPFKNDTMPYFLVRSTIKVGFLINDSLRTGTIKYADLDSFKIDNDLFEVKDVKIDLWKFKNKQKNLILYILKDFKKTRLIKAFTTMPLNSNNPFSERSMILIHNKLNDRYYSVSDVNIFTSYNKLISRALKIDCPGFAQKVKRAKNKVKSLEDIKKILEEYDNCKE